MTSLAAPFDPGGDAAWVETPSLPPRCAFPLLDATGLVTCGFSTRLGGVSVAPFDSLNLGSTTKDDPACVQVNRARFGEAFGHEVLEWIRLVHGNAVHEAREGEATFLPGDHLPAADAVITDRRGLPLVIYTADCVPIALLDPVAPAVGLVHAGWRGTVEEVAATTVRAMQARYGTDPQRLLCGLGASIGPCCFVVHDDVAAPVRDRFPQWQDSVVSVINTPSNSRQQYRVDLWQLNALQLERAGVARANIAISRLCTACRDDLFFSYRRDRRETGRLAMLLALR